jgi:hypothetical protein
MIDVDIEQRLGSFELKVAFRAEALIASEWLTRRSRNKAGVDDRR